MGERVGGDDEVEGVRQGRKDCHAMGGAGNSDYTPLDGVQRGNQPLQS